MVGGYVAGHGHVESVETKIGIIVMEIRNPFFFALFAAVFAYIMTGGGAGYKPQIYGNFQR